MKKLILLVGIILAPAVNAHHFALQEWHNPTTGQTIVECFDVHQTDNSSISPTAHRHALVAWAKKNNALVITEDKPSLHFGGIDYNDTSASNKETINNYMLEFPLDCALAWSQAECFINDVEVFNAECRELDKTKSVNPRYEKEIAAYNDGPILNDFYKNITSLAQDLDGVNQRSSTFNHKCFMVDARALNALYTAKNRVILLTMGATHIIRINRLLLQLGWQQGPATVPTAYDETQKEILTTALTPDRESLRNTLDSWSGYLNNHIDTITNHSVSIAQLELTPFFPAQMSEQKLITLPHNPMTLLTSTFMSTLLLPTALDTTSLIFI